MVPSSYRSFAPRPMARSLLVRVIMNWLVPLVERLAHVLTLLASLGLVDRKAHLEVLRQTLIGNSLIFAVWACWEVHNEPRSERRTDKWVASRIIRRPSRQLGAEDAFEEEEIPTPPVPHPPSLAISRPQVTFRIAPCGDVGQLLASISVPIPRDASGLSGALGVDVAFAELVEDALLHPDHAKLSLLAALEREVSGALIVISSNHHIIGATTQALQRIHEFSGILCQRGQRLPDVLLPLLKSASADDAAKPRRAQAETRGHKFAAWTAPLASKGRKMVFFETIADSPAAPSQALSARETEVLRCLAQGNSNGEIASALGISASTVKNHLERVFKKLGVTNRCAAIARGFNPA